jgi:hypothetical protein
MFRVVGGMAAIFVAVWFFTGERVTFFGGDSAALRPGGSPMSSGPQQPASTAPSVGVPERAAPTPAPLAEAHREIIRFVTAGGTLGMVEHDSEIPVGARVLGRTVRPAGGEGRPVAEAVASADGGNGNKVRAKKEREADSRQQADKWRGIVRDTFRKYSDMRSRVSQEGRVFDGCGDYPECRNAFAAWEMAWLEMQRLHEYLTTTIFRECELAGCEREWILPSTEMERSQRDALESEHKGLAISYQAYERNANDRLETKRHQDEYRQKRADEIR